MATSRRPPPGQAEGGKIAGSAHDAANHPQDNEDIQNPGDVKSRKPHFTEIMKSFMRQYVSDRNTNTTDNDRQHSINKKNFIVILIYTVITGVIMVVNVVQYGDNHRFNKKQFRVISQQLKEIQSGSAQTDRLISAATDQARAANELAKSSEASLVASQRAWIGPDIASLPGPVTENMPAKIEVIYQNTGRSPAENYYNITNTIIFNNLQWSNGFAGTKIHDLEEQCKIFQAPPTGGQTVFPNKSYRLTFNVDLLYDKRIVKPKIPKFTRSVVDGKDVIVFHICQIYRTIGATGHSSTCFFYHAGLSPPQSLNFCNIGNSAD